MCRGTNYVRRTLVKKCVEITSSFAGGFHVFPQISRPSARTTQPPEGPGRRDDYDGTITKYGLDLGLTGGGVMVWAVFTDTLAGPGFLAGDYIGASGEISIAAGLGANVLLGGSNPWEHWNTRGIEMLPTTSPTPSIRGSSAYPPIFAVNADIPARRPSATADIWPLRKWPSGA
jgi:hypothetical protein